MSYEKLHAHFRRLGQLDEVSAIVQWDQAVNMPESAGPARAEAMAGFLRVRHELLVDPRVGEWLSVAAEQADLGDFEVANLLQMRRLYRRATAVPADLVEASAQADNESEQAWRRYRAENDFASFAPHLEQVLSLKRQVAEALSEALGLSVYDALMDEFEPGIRARDIDRTFAPLEAFLPAFTDEVLERQAGEPVTTPRGPFTIEQQRDLGLAMMRAVGFDLSRGRLDVSHHPFCGGTGSDVRITTRYDERDFTSALMGVLHESGHGKYEQGLPSLWRHQPVGLARGMAMHESQSLLLEMQVCRGREFLRFAAPLIERAFPQNAKQQPDALSFDNLERLYTRVRRSYIRVDADEVTYPAHILLRYDLERQLIDGRMSVRQLPDAWDSGMRRLLQLSTSGNDRDGCMQDVHWPSGAFGYFPLYTLGAMVAAQLFASVLREHPTVTDELERGSFETLDAWLRENVWRWGSRYATDELLERATGERLNPEHFITHLRQRYLPSS